MFEKTLLLFDVDGTLTLPRQQISPETDAFIKELRHRVSLGVVGGSDFGKIVEQLGQSAEQVLCSYDYVFSENGLIGFHGHQPYPIKTIQDHIGESKLQKFINFALSYLSTVELPVKRGTFVEFRKGMINFSPIGRSCSQEERKEFAIFDKEHGIRAKFVEKLRTHFPVDEYDLHISIGGQISIDVFPRGWDKTFCLQYLSNFDIIHFFGDRTSPGGNDYEIFHDLRTIGHSVTGPEDTVEQIKRLHL